jgi:hypothetical protein
MLASNHRKVFEYIMDIWVWTQIWWQLRKKTSKGWKGTVYKILVVNLSWDLVMWFSCCTVWLMVCNRFTAAVVNVLILVYVIACIFVPLIVVYLHLQVVITSLVRLCQSLYFILFYFILYTPYIRTELFVVCWTAHIILCKKCHFIGCT